MQDGLERFWKFVIKRHQGLGIVALWVISLLPGLIVSLRKGDPWHATAVVMAIQLLASFGSITLFGVVAQIICYKYIESVEVHDRMMDGLFFGFHAGMILWVGYGFFHILFGRKIIGNVNDLVAIFGVSCIGSCILGIAIGFLVGKLRDGNSSIV
ncbi:hypothetical protein [Desulfovibrio sp. TomC]|uniref:hypothetical protein n=1 Tax=Desulfovibrio sp. TomC TaxID=1562888 RepID=UPI0005750F1B|nr:hypothetical protein [Desulfovibrio sp. TomC]KHK01407.1 hypothetical protein NY78_3161 [Desulfovibrio sp. TomC]